MSWAVATTRLSFPQAPQSSAQRSASKIASWKSLAGCAGCVWARHVAKPPLISITSPKLWDDEEENSAERFAMFFQVLKPTQACFSLGWAVPSSLPCLTCSIALRLPLPSAPGSSPPGGHLTCLLWWRELGSAVWSGSLPFSHHWCEVSAVQKKGGAGSAMISDFLQRLPLVCPWKVSSKQRCFESTTQCLLKSTASSFRRHNVMERKQARLPQRRTAWLVC